MIYLVKIYAKIYEFFHKYFSINLPGLGFLYRFLKTNQFFIVKNKKLFFNSNISDNYGMLINGVFNEKETHLFLDQVFKNKKIDNFHFIDVGGNIGEFVLDYSDHWNVKKITVFEPQPEQIESIKKTILENDFHKTILIESPVSNRIEEVYFNFNKKNSTASGITQDSNNGTIINAITLDEVFKDNYFQTFVILVDTEGQELNAMKGAINLINKSKPLIIFEYNHVTNKVFKIQDVKDYLGKDYVIYRLNKNGRLDLDFSDIWNLVAIPNSIQFDYLNQLIDIKNN